MICEHCNGTGQREVSQNELTRGGQVVGVVSGGVEVQGPKQIELGEVLIQGDLDGPLAFGRRTIRILKAREHIGLEVGDKGARGPLLKGVICEVVG